LDDYKLIFTPKKLFSETRKQQIVGHIIALWSSTETQNCEENFVLEIKKKESRLLLHRHRVQISLYLRPVLMDVLFGYHISNFADLAASL